MKKTKMVLLIGLISLGVISVSAMSEMVYQTKVNFEKNEGETCKQASDGCNIFGVENGKITYGTERYCENHIEKWSCIEKERENKSNKSLPISITASITNNSNTAPYKYGKITKIENGKDGQNIYITTDKGEIHSTAVSIHDRVDDEGNFGLYMGSKIKIFYYDEVEKMNLLIGDVVEIVTDGLSENDKNHLDVLEKGVNSKYKQKVNKFLVKYEEILKKIDSKKAIKRHNKILKKVDEIISKFLMQFPQDIGLSKKDAEKFSRLSYLELRLIELDFHKEVLLGNSEKDNCELEGNAWEKVGMLQTETCITKYSDGGKTCDSSSDCQGNCNVSNPDTPAVCAKDNNVFGCKTTIEDFNKGEGIMCVD